MKLNLPNLIFVTLLWLFSSSLMAAPKADLWPHWKQSNEKSNKTVDHQSWQDLLDRHVKSTGTPPATRVDYKAFSDSDKKQLADYITRLGKEDVLSLSMKEQKAYWFNLYNAVTVKLILDHYPVESIRDIRFGFFSFGPWNEKLISVGGKSLSLNDVEHRILRPIWKDERIHYAVNCASIGCPNLSNQAFTAENTEQQLEKAASDYINHPRGVRFDGDDLILSSIYDWYEVDFGDSLESLKKHLIRYASPELKERLTSHSGSADYFYDWKLNAP